MTISAVQNRRKLRRDTPHSPKEVLLIGISGKSYQTDCTLSASVREAAPSAVATVLHELKGPGFVFSEKRSDKTLPAAWTPTLAPVSV